jgi:hypothetical protein
MLSGIIKRFVAFTAAMVAASLSTAQASMVIDLKTAGFNSGFQTAAQGGTFFATTDATQATGSGNWDAFSRVDATGSNTSEQGYNTPVNKVLDNVDGSNTHLITLGGIPTVTDASGQVWRVFGLDINQENSGTKPLLSLNQVQIFASTTDPGASGVVTGTEPQIAFGAGFNEVFRLNNRNDPNFYEIQLNAQLNAGSGHDNMLLYVNNAAFNGLPDSTLITLYSQFGSSPGVYPTNDGYEEWAAITSGNIPSPMPEPSTIIEAGVAGLLALGYAWRRKAKAAASSRGKVSGSGDHQS